MTAFDLRKISDLNKREQIKELRQIKTAINDGISIMALIGQDFKQTAEFKQLTKRHNEIMESLTN